MDQIKNIAKIWNKETLELIEISREVLRISRQLRAKKSESTPSKPLTPYEKVVKTNPYISEYEIIAYN